MKIPYKIPNNDDFFNTVDGQLISNIVDIGMLGYQI